MTIDEIRSEFQTDTSALRLAPDGGLCYQTDNDNEPYIVIRTPHEHTRIVALAYSILLLDHQELFEGGLVWLQMWQVGSPQMVRPGWKIIEGMRRAQGDLRSLDIAPAQTFRHDEFVELHAWLVQIMAYGWFAYFVPSAGEFFLLFTTTGKILCTAKSSEMLETLYSRLKRWEPVKEFPDSAGGAA